MIKLQTNRVVARQPGKAGRPVAAMRASFAERTERARMPEPSVSFEGARGKNSPMNQLGGYEFADLRIGMSATFAKTITEADIVLFAAVSGDNNALHINAEYAATTIFETRIAHGMLSASVISAAIANKLPGPGSIYLSQSLRFRAPVRAGDTVHAIVTVTELLSKRSRVLLSTECTVRGVVVISGEALVLLPAPVRGPSPILEHAEAMTA